MQGISDESFAKAFNLPESLRPGGALARQGCHGFAVAGSVVQVQHVTTYQGAALGFAAIADGLAVVEEGGYLRLIYAARDDTRLGSILLAEGVAAATPTAGDPLIGSGSGDDLAVQETATRPRIFVFSSHDGLLRQAVLSETATPGLTKPANTTADPLYGVTAMAVFEQGPGDLVALARSGQPGVEIYRLGDAGGLSLVASISDGPKAYLADVADLAGLQVAGRNFLLIASPLEDGLSLFEIDAAGQAHFLDALGAQNGLPIGGPRALQTVSVAGLDYVLVASTLSSSLSVIRVNPQGVMFAVSHLVDDRASRFADVAALDAFAWQGRVFVVAAGSDAGLSLLELLPDGQLSHVTALALETGAGIGAVAGIAAQVIGAAAAVFLTDSSGARIDRLAVDLAAVGGVIRPSGGQATGSALEERLWGGAGAETLAGGGGADFLHDGAGGDVLTGGSGADVFVFARDGVADRISDFQAGQDRIDVSDWGRIYSSAALSIAATASGATVSYGAETLTIIRQGGGSLPLTEADFLF